MQLKIGTYAFAANAASITTNISTEFTPFGLPMKQTKTLNVEAYLDGSSQSDLSTATTALEAVLAGNAIPDITFYQDDGTPSATRLTRNGSLGGIRITSGPNFVAVQGNDYVNLRKCNFTAEATYLLTAGFYNSMYVEFNEVVEWEGGYPVYVLRPNVNGPWQPQLVYPLAPVYITQRGSGKGWRDWPQAPAPLFSPFLKGPRLSKGSPENAGLGVYINYPITWEYTFGFPSLLTPTPTPWPS